jgi:hypothetical protein
MEWESATCCGVNLAFAVFGGVGFVFCKLQDRALTQNSPTGIVARRKVDSLQPASTPDTRWILCNRHRRPTRGGDIPQAAWLRVGNSELFRVFQAGIRTSAPCLSYWWS